MAGRRRVGSSVLRGHRPSRGGRRLYARDARGRFAATGATSGGPTEDNKRRSRRRTAAGLTVAVGAGVAAGAGAKRARTAPTRRRIQRAHQRRVYRDLGKMALHRGTAFDQTAARKLARVEYRQIRRHYRKTVRSDKKRARKSRRS